LDELWEANIKYGYIVGKNEFFFVLFVIDVFDRAIIGYHIGCSCKSADAINLLKRCLLKRDLYEKDKKLVIRTDVFSFDV
jgi:putative transposase